MYDFLNKPHFEYYNLRIAILGKGIFKSNAERLQNEFQEYGINACFFEKYSDIFDFKPNCVVVTCPIYYPYKEFKDRSIVWVGINGEQIATPEFGSGWNLTKRLNEVKEYCKKFDILFDNSESSARVIRSFFNGPVGVVQRNCYPANLSIPDFISDEKKEYDILFYGSTPNYPRRRDVVQFLASKYNVFPKNDNLWGEDLVDAIKKSKICLNLHAEESRYFEKMRFIQLFSNHAFVMSDRIFDSGDFVDGEDFATFFLTDMCDRIDYYLANEEIRKFMADNAYRKIKESEKETDCYAAKILDYILLERQRKHIFENPPLYKRIARRIGALLG